MKDTKKIKLGKLNFYIIDDNYIKYLSQFDKHIAYNKNQKRPYIGVVIVVGEHYYFAPLFSPKPKHKNYKDNLTFFKIVNTKTKNDLGIIRFSDMIPVPQNSVYLLDSFEGRIHITNENKPRIRYTKNDTEQEEDLTTCIRENVEISLKKIVSLFEPSSENIEITVEVDGKQIKWKGSIILDLE